MRFGILNSSSGLDSWDAPLDLLLALADAILMASLVDVGLLFMSMLIVAGEF